MCSRNYLPLENRSNSMGTASLKSKVLQLITFKVDSFSMDTLVPAFLPWTLTFSFLELPTAVPFHYVKTFTYHQIFWIPRFLPKLYIKKKMQGGSVGCFTSKILVLKTCCMMWTEWITKVLSCLLTFMILFITDIPIHINRHGD